MQGMHTQCIRSAFQQPVWLLWSISHYSKCLQGAHREPRLHPGGPESLLTVLGKTLGSFGHCQYSEEVPSFGQGLFCSWGGDGKARIQIGSAAHSRMRVIPGLGSVLQGERVVFSTLTPNPAQNGSGEAGALAYDVPGTVSLSSTLKPFKHTVSGVSWSR